MIETIELRITSPKVEIPGLDAAITSLKEFRDIYAQVQKLGAITVQGFQGVAGQARQMSDASKIMLQGFERLKDVDATAATRRGFDTIEQELNYIDAKMAQFRALMAGAPQAGSPLRVGNPALDKRLSEVESAQAGLRLRREELTGFQSGAHPSIQAAKQFEQDAVAMQKAEQAISSASAGATVSLTQQGQAVTTKAGQMGTLTTALGGATQAENAATAAMGEHVTLSEKYIETGEGVEFASRRVATGIGVVRTELDEEGKTYVENTNFVEQYRSALRANATEFANRSVAVQRGSAGEVQLLRDEAAGIQNITRSFGQFVGLAEQQRAETRSASLLRRANELERQMSSASVQRFEQLRPQFAEPAETRRTTLPTGESIQRTVLSRETEGIRQTLTLTERMDSTGKRLNATLDETSKKMEAAWGRTTQGSLLGTIGMAAKFIAIYRGLDVVIRAFEFGIESAIKFERQLATLSIVYHGTSEEARGLGLAVLEQAAMLGQSGTAALEVATDFARFGFREAEVIEATRVAMVAANVAQLDLAQSGKYLQAIMAGYQVQVGQLSGILGGLDTVSHSYNVTNTQLLEGLSRVAPLAKQAGISLNELIGYEAVISGRTARPGAEAGTALKSVISRVSRPSTQQALQEIAGINVLAPTGDLKTFPELLREIFIAYQNLTRAEQQELLVKIAGTQQASRIAALLDGYLKSQELSIRASLDQTRAERENIAVRQSLSSQLGTLSTQWQRFWAASGQGAGGLQSNITEIIKSLSIMLDQLSRAEGHRAPVRGTEQLTREEIETELSGLLKQNVHGVPRVLREAMIGVGIVSPFATNLSNAPAIARAENLEHQLELLEKQKKGTLDLADSEKLADQQLIKFNQDLQIGQERANAYGQVAANIKTIDQLIDRASPQKLLVLADALARISAPGDVQRQQQLRDEFTAMAKLNDVAAIHAALRRQLAAAQGDETRQRTVNIQKIQDELEVKAKEIDQEETRKATASRAGKADDVRAIDLVIEGKQRQLSDLQRELTGAAAAIPEDIEDQYAISPEKAAEKQTEAAQAAAEGIKAVYKSLTQPASEVEKIDREVLAVQEEIAAIERQRAELSHSIAGMSDREREARREALAQQLELVKAEGDRLQIIRDYAKEQDAIIQRQRDLGNAFEGIKRVFESFPKFELFGAGGTSAVADLNREVSELLEKVREVQRQQGGVEEGAVASYLQSQFGNMNLLIERAQEAAAAAGGTGKEFTGNKIQYGKTSLGGAAEIASVDLEPTGVITIDLKKFEEEYRKLQQAVERGAYSGIEKEQAELFAKSRENFMTEVLTHESLHPKIPGFTEDEIEDAAWPIAQASIRAREQTAQWTSPFLESLMAPAESTQFPFLPPQGPAGPGAHSYVPYDADEARRVEAETLATRDRTVQLGNLEADAQREVLRIEKEKLDALREYAQLQDAIAGGARQGRIQPEQFRVGRNETEQLVTEAVGIQQNLLPTALEKINAAGGNKLELGRAQGEAIELVNRLTTIQISLDEHRYKLAADIANEKRKETEEASKNLQLASREDQLRAAAVARFVRNRGGQGFSSNEFQFLDQETRQAILRFNPSALPSSVPTRSRELEIEQRELTGVFKQLSASLEGTVKSIQAKLEGNLVTAGQRRVDASKLPGAINLPAVNIDVKDQFAQLTRYLGQVVTARFEAELGGIRSELTAFINKNRINAAQSAATGAT